MELVNRQGYYYLKHSFRKRGKVISREQYIGKEVPENIELIKQTFLRKCLAEDLFKRIRQIRKAFLADWKKYPETIKKKILLDFAVEFTYNTNAIEGSTISLEETEDVIKRRIAANKPVDELEETKNHAQVFLKMVGEKRHLSLSLLCEWHKEVFGQSKPDIAGKIRNYLVRVGQYRAPDWQDLPKLMKEFVSWYSQNEKSMNAVELAARAHYKFEKIHPFGDGNGRIGRLIINYALRKREHPMLIIEYKKRKLYYAALAKTENDFVNYFIRRYIKAYSKYLK